MAETNSVLASKINRAVQALLISEGAATSLDTFAAPTADERISGSTTIEAGQGTEHVRDTGNFKFDNVLVFLRDPALLPEGATNPELMRLRAGERFSKVRTALNRVGDDGSTLFLPRALNTAGRALATTGSAQDQANHADMAQFTVFHWRLMDEEALKAENTWWESALQFECIACNAAFTV